MKPQPHSLVNLFSSPQFRFFCEVFRITADPVKELEKFLEQIQKDDPRFNQGVEWFRYELVKSQNLYDSRVTKAIMDLADLIGLRNVETPLVGRFTFAVALAGANDSCYDRLFAIVKAILANKLSATSIWIVGSDRVLKPAEQNKVAHYALGAQTEFDLCEAAANRIMRENGLFTVFTHHVEKVDATNEDVVTSLLEYLICRTLFIESFVASTTQIYQPFTALSVALVASRFGIANTFVGGHPSLQTTIDNRTADSYLTEVIKFLRTLAQYCDEMPEISD